MKLTKFELAALKYLEKFDKNCNDYSFSMEVSNAMIALRRIAYDGGLFKKAMGQKHEEELALLRDVEKESFVVLTRR